MKRSHGLLLSLAIVVLGVVGIVVGLLVFVPRYIERRVVAEARARGIELIPGDIGFGWQWVQVSDAKAKLIGAPSFEAAIGLVDIQLGNNWQPAVIEASNVKVGVGGSLPRVLLELGEWTKNNPKAFDLPVIASRLRLQVAEQPAGAPWLEVSEGFMTRTTAGAVFSAQSCKLSGFELGKVGAGFTTTGGSVSIGFGDQSTQAAPLRIDAAVDASGGKVTMVLTPTKLGLLGKALGIALPLPDVVAAANVELRFPPGLTRGEVTGKLTSNLKGFIPPHPPELAGFVFGDITTFETELKIDESRNRVTLTESRVAAGKFELRGGGSVVREGQVAVVELDLRGLLPCDALAGAAAESRLGQLLGRASGRQGKRTALAIVGGDVQVTVSVKARSSELDKAELTRRIGIGCGLRPLSLEELIALAPTEAELQAIGGEVGKKLETLGKDLGLPPVPSGFPPVPSGLRLPQLPKLPDFGQGPASPRNDKTPRQLAAPAPSG